MFLCSCSPFLAIEHYKKCFFMLLFEFQELVGIFNTRSLTIFSFMWALYSTHTSTNKRPLIFKDPKVGSKRARMLFWFMEELQIRNTFTLLQIWNAAKIAWYAIIYISIILWELTYKRGNTISIERKVKYRFKSNRVWTFMSSDLTNDFHHQHIQ